MKPSDPRSSLNFLSFDKLDLVAKTVDKVFPEKIKCTKEEHEILLLKAYSNVLEGSEIILIDKQVPDEEIDTYKQYDKKCRVLFRDPNGNNHTFYMSYQNSGREAVNYWKLKYYRLKERGDHV